jgi:hypothetical protein
MNPHDQLQTFYRQTLLKKFTSRGLVNQSVRLIAAAAVVAVDNILLFRAEVNGKNAVIGISAFHAKLEHVRPVLWLICIMHRCPNNGQ